MNSTHKDYIDNQISNLSNNLLTLSDRIQQNVFDQASDNEKKLNKLLNQDKETQKKLDERLKTYDKEMQKKLDERLKTQDNINIQTNRIEKQLQGLYSYLGLSSNDNLIEGLGKTENVSNLDPAVQFRFLQAEFKNVNNKLPVLLNMVTPLLMIAMVIYYNR